MVSNMLDAIYIFDNYLFICQTTFLLLSLLQSNSNEDVRVRALNWVAYSEII